MMKMHLNLGDSLRPTFSFLLNPRCIINESWTYCVLAFRVLMPKKNCVFIYIQRFNRSQVHLIFTGP